jgi:hypothetical protein
LNETIKSWNAIATGRILSKHRQKRYSQFDYLNLSKELGTCVPGNQRYHLSSGALALHDRNLNSDELKELFRRVGIENLWEGISASAAIQNHFQITGRAAVQKISQAKLDEFISLRNQVAHNRGGESAVGPEALGQWIDFFLALAECLSAIAVDYCNKLSV